MRKLGSFFDGIGGFPYIARLYGIEPVWASEIEKAPISITKRHFPNMKHLGNITKINGAEIEPVDIITGGSPCQDLSVAGKRAGLDGERSGLFMEMIRVIKEMRKATNGIYPAFVVWENVPGAFSSNKGEDFRAVIEEFCSIQESRADIPRPDGGKWADAGGVVGEGFSFAWRVLDAQHMGVPQRRRRIYAVLALNDFTGRRAGEILFKPQSERRHSTPSGAPWKRFTRTTESGVDGVSNSGFISMGFSYKASAGAGTVGVAEETAPSLLGARHDAAVCLGNGQADIASHITEDVCQTPYCIQGNSIDREEAEAALEAKI